MDEASKMNRIARYLSGELSESEQKAFLVWIEDSKENQLLFEDMSHTWNIVEQVPNDAFEVNIEEGWEKFEEKFSAQESFPTIKTKNTQMFGIRQLLRVAALFIGISLTGWAVYNYGLQEERLPIVINTAADQTDELILPDGSKVWMNERSTLTYDQAFEPRKIILVGEAYFEVEYLEGKSFEITAGHTKTTVLGTAFNVRAYPEETSIEVSVTEGKVSFKSQTDESTKIYLGVGDAGVFKNEKIAMDSLTSNGAAWKLQRLEFNNTPMSEVIPTLNRYFGKNIEVTNSSILNCPFTGTYEDPEFKKLIEILAFSLNLKVEVKNEKYFLSGEGC